jgi:AraC family transcriptional regulator
MHGVGENEACGSLPDPCWGWHGDDVITTRRMIHQGRAVLVEDSRRSASDPIGSGLADCIQFAFPYYGAFAWCTGSKSRIVDANSVLFIAKGQEFRETHPSAKVGHASVIFTPDSDLVDEAQARAKRSIRAVDAVTRPVPDATRLAVHRLAFDTELTALAIEELVLWLVQSFFDTDNVDDVPAARQGHAIINQAKEILYEAGSRPVSLDEVAGQIGVSPIYLTQCFSRNEGMPLYRYQMRLRLSRALVELPRCGSLTELALDLGFSSHAHFTSTFRSAFGMTPSAFRAEHRRRCYPVAA